jgi:hypothetical protein
MNLQVGAGTVELPGFRNVDVRPNKGVHIVDDATVLSSVQGGSVEILFGNAIFEHFYLGRHLAALRRWKDVLAPDGVIVMTGIPDFAVIARLYLEGAAGIVGERFDLFNVYRYTHGHPEHATRAVSTEWHPNGSMPPDGWIPQLHKCLMDAGYLRDLLGQTGLAGTLFHYAFPREPHALNLGVIAAHSLLADASLDAIRRTLQRIPTIETMVALESIALCQPAQPRGRMIVEADRLDGLPAPKLKHRIRWQILKFFGSH